MDELKQNIDYMIETLGHGVMRLDKDGKGMDLFHPCSRVRIEMMNDGWMWSVFDNEGLVGTSNIFGTVKECIDNCKATRF